MLHDLIHAILRWLFPALYAELDELETRIVSLRADVFYRQRGIALVN